jgi:DNA-binding NarL/FixJ family response regulator
MEYNTVNLAIADDHEIFREGLTLLINKIPDFRLAGEARNGKELLTLLKNEPVDVVLMDIRMPELNGLEATKILRKDMPDIKIIALTMFDDEQNILNMYHAGVSGYLLKNTNKVQFEEAVRTVYNGGTYFSNDATIHLIRKAVKEKDPDYGQPFNERETEIIKLLCKQYSSKEIADKICLSVRTVEGYRMKIMKKINVKNHSGIVLFALKNGLIEQDEV